MVNLVSVGNKNIMTQKVDPAFVKAAFELAGYQMLGEYERNHIPIEFRCNKGHIGRVSWKDFRGKGTRCAVCSGKAVLPEIVKAAFELAGYQMLSEYINCSTPIKFKCDQNHLGEITWSIFKGSERKAGSRCATCAGNYVSPEFVKSQFELAGYQMLSEYVNNKKKIDFICNHGHRSDVSWRDFRGGSRCRICMKKYVPPEFVKQQFALNGYTMIDEYVSAETPIRFVCDKGHQGQIRWSNFRDKPHKKGSRCGICLKKRVDLDSVRAKFELNGYELLSEYMGSKEPIKVKCPKGHSFTTTWNSFDKGTRCGICFQESAVFNYVNNPPRSRIIVSIRNSIKRLELNHKWQDYYSSCEIKVLAEKVESVYKNVPQGYHVDHIIPVSWFALINRVELEACWNLKNLRYLPILENIKKSNKLGEGECLRLDPELQEILKTASRRPNFYDINSTDFPVAI